MQTSLQEESVAGLIDNDVYVEVGNEKFALVEHRSAGRESDLAAAKALLTGAPGSDTWSNGARALVCLLPKLLPSPSVRVRFRPAVQERLKTRHGSLPTRTAWGSQIPEIHTR